MNSKQASDQQAIGLYRKLVDEFNKKPVKLDKCRELLDQLKLLLTKLSFLPTTNDFTKQDLIISRDCLEIGAQISVASRDIPAFERYMSQLKTYYFDFRWVLYETIWKTILIVMFCFPVSSDDLPESAFKYQLLGLNLLCLLSQNRVAEFHTVSYRTHWV